MRYEEFMSNCLDTLSNFQEGISENKEKVRLNSCLLLCRA